VGTKPALKSRNSVVVGKSVNRKSNRPKHRRGSERSPQQKETCQDKGTSRDSISRGSELLSVKRSGVTLPGGVKEKEFLLHSKERRERGGSSRGNLGNKGPEKM